MPYWMFSRPQRKLYRLPLTVTALHEVAGGDEWAGKREQHIAFEERLEREGIKRPGARRDASGSGGRTHAALVRSLGLAFDSSETKRLELTIAGQTLAEGSRPIDVLKHQVMRFQYPSPYSLQIGIEERFRLRPMVLVLRLLLHPGLGGSLTIDDMAFVVMVEGVSDSAKEAERIAGLLAEYARNGIDEDDFVARYGKPDDTFDALQKRLFDIANTAFNWLEITGVIERGKRKISLPDSLVTEAEALVAKYGDAKLIPSPDNVDKFQRAYGLTDEKKKDTRNLTTARKALPRSEIVYRQVNTVLTRWAENELLIDGATSEIVDRLVGETQFSHGEVEKVARRILGTDRTLSSYLLHYQSLVTSSDRNAPREFEQATAEIIRRVFKLEATCVGQTGREPDIVVRKPGEWRGIIDTKAYGGEYSLPSGHDRAMREYVEKYSGDGGDDLRFWVFLAGSLSKNAGARARELAQRIGCQGVVIGLSAWMKMIELGQAGKLSGDKLGWLFSLDGELTHADIARAQEAASFAELHAQRGLF
ncbi:hypothetical protein DTO57_13075 [Microbacterium sorbitolivorans]|uniref:Uncharacterized protein n=2 Tax=Microbacterium sorbitolivorans TaxID=1867410 RepID=A0A367XT96_9MICO|nr:hypothetical protein DTO57_13075 [Microbacterium sorbitolivorans]